MTSAGWWCQVANCAYILVTHFDEGICWSLDWYAESPRLRKAEIFCH